MGSDDRLAGNWDPLDCALVDSCSDDDGESKLDCNEDEPICASARRFKPVDKSWAGFGFAVKNARSDDCPGDVARADDLKLEPFVSVFFRLGAEV